MPTSDDQSLGLYEWARSWMLDSSQSFWDIAEGVNYELSLLATKTTVTDRFIGGTRGMRLEVVLSTIAPVEEGEEVVNSKLVHMGERWLSWIEDRWINEIPRLRSFEGTLLCVEASDDSPMVFNVLRESGLVSYEFYAHIDYRI